MNKNVHLTVLVVSILFFSICSADLVYSSGNSDRITATVMGVGEFGGMELDITFDDLNQHGCNFGDMLLVSANGKEFNSVLIFGSCGVGTYDSYVTTQCTVDTDALMFGIFNANVWKITGLKVGDTIQMERNGVSPYLFQLEKYMAGVCDDPTGVSAEDFCNLFRVESPGMRDDFIAYRSVSPYNPSNVRAHMVADMYRELGIEYIVSLGFAEDAIDKCRDLYGDSYYPVELFDQGKAYVKLIDPVANRSPEEYRDVMIAISESEGPLAINCVHGKDRTGLVAAMLQALTGASYEQIKEDYLKSYVHHYRVEVDSNEYNLLGVMMFDRLFYSLEYPELEEQAGNIDWSIINNHAFNLKKITLTFLKERAGMTDHEIGKLMERISNEPYDGSW